MMINTFDNFSSLASVGFSFSLIRVHVYQRMYGCEWNNETGEVSGYHQYGYDGEDWIIFDMKENRWIAAKQQAVITTNRWNNNRGYLEKYKNYFNQICPAWLKKYVDYGRSSLMSTGIKSHILIFFVLIDYFNLSLELNKKICLYLNFF
uniref:MHC class I-like antigen recognition-like domain-containing protein n=1 Tax=Fundulus heteroclitus TaxID=8078 RepID=A0A3Q2PYX4_FUNHE